MPLYYALRVERIGSRASWGMEFIHDKLYLENRPPEVQLFNATHGFNILSVIRTSAGHGLRYRLGMGAVLAHVENQVRGRKLPQTGVHGYHLTGPIAQAGLGYEIRVSRNTAFVADAKLTGARVRFPVMMGHARFFAAETHFSAGLSQRF
jgi:hypothetical protein